MPNLKLEKDSDSEENSAKREKVWVGERVDILIAKSDERRPRGEKRTEALT